MTVLVVVLLLAAAAAGFAAQRRLLHSRRHDDPLAEAEGLPASELVIPVRTLAALLLAFVLLSVYGSFEEADDQAAAEAGAVLAMGEDALGLPAGEREGVFAALRCYTRAVIGPDWEAQVDGHGSQVADQASNRIIEVLAVSGEGGAAVATAALLSDDSTRIHARIARIHEGEPSVPLVVSALLVLTVVIMVGGLAALGHPSVRTKVQLGVLAGTTVVFGMTLLVVHDLDRPYSGLAKIQPTAMENVQAQLERLPGAIAVALPCDERGAYR